MEKKIWAEWKPILESENHCQIYDDDSSFALDKLLTKEEAFIGFIHCTIVSKKQN